ncbi:MAG TPA: hypothetical protein VGO08_12585 [Burkholderiales bacterium]|nr:hypothetical protein [Burkholderiales bacterium]
MREATHGVGVDVVFDSIGKATLATASAHLAAGGSSSITGAYRDRYTISTDRAG